MSNKQQQKGGDHSANLQAGEIHLHVGMSATEVHRYIESLFEANRPSYSPDADKLARDREKHLISAVIHELQARNVQLPTMVGAPIIQQRLVETQQVVTRYGDPMLEGLLVRLLADLGEAAPRSLEQIVLNESLRVASLLTADQLNILTLVFILRHTVNQTVVDRESLHGYVLSRLVPFLDALPEKESAYQHLVYTGCAIRGIERLSRFRVLKQLQQTYLAAFTDEFDADEIAEFTFVPAGTFVPSRANPGRLRSTVQHVDALTRLQEDVQKLADDPHEAGMFMHLFRSHVMNPSQIRDEMEAADPRMGKLIEMFESSTLGLITLTTVGISIARANFQRVTNLPVVPLSALI